jgi:hypothetical protein
LRGKAGNPKTEIQNPKPILGRAEWFALVGSAGNSGRARETLLGVV